MSDNLNNESPSAVQATQPSKTCHKCGAQLDENDSYCKNCGVWLAVPNPQTPPPQDPSKTPPVKDSKYKKFGCEYRRYHY
jgi:hypothetical protein